MAGVDAAAVVALMADDHVRRGRKFVVYSATHMKPIGQHVGADTHPIKACPAIPVLFSVGPFYAVICCWNCLDEMA